MMSPMLKGFLIVLAFAVVVDAAAFEGHYRQEVIETTVFILRKLVTLDWSLTHDRHV